MAKKEETKDLLESPEIIAEKLEGVEHWAEQNPKIVFGILGALVLAVGGYFGFRYYLNSQETLAQQDMFQAIHYFEADSLDIALKGDGINLGFEQIIDDYGLTEAANLAHFYAGVIALKQGKYQLALFFLENFDADDILVQARAYSLMGDSHMELKEYDQAAQYYRKASAHYPNKFFSPTYLMKAALAFEKANQKEKAIAAYQEIIDKFWDSSEYQNARKYKALLESKG